jgi:regulator of protease activity HflC (stomatin/prohibitin superfamily)
MDAALGWIGEIIAWIACWIPQIIHVKATEKGVKYIRSRAELIEPGLHLYWPITTQVNLYPVVRQVLDLPTQTVVCKDETASGGSTAVAVGGVVIYTITDLYMFLVDNYDASASMVEAAQTGIRKAVLAESVQSINGGRAAIDNRLTKEVQAAVKSFGVEVEAARLTTFSPTQVLSLLSDGSAYEGAAAAPE